MGFTFGLPSVGFGLLDSLFWGGFVEFVCFWNFVAFRLVYLVDLCVETLGCGRLEGLV